MFISTTERPTMACLLSTYDSVWIIKNNINIQQQATLANGIFLFSISPFKLINELTSEKKQYQTSIDWSEVTLVPFSINVSISYALRTIEGWIFVSWEYFIAGTRDQGSGAVLVHFFVLPLTHLVSSGEPPKVAGTSVPTWRSDARHNWLIPLKHWATTWWKEQ